MRKPTSKTSSSSETRRSKGRKECSSSSKRRVNKEDDRAAEELKKGPWTAEEDELLVRYIKTQGEGGWRTLPKRAGLLRCGKSCRLRWMNYLRPNVKRGHITPDEEDLILRLHRLLGNRWSLIAGRIPGRTDNEIKNYWNTHLSKKLIRQGIDPRTHKPFSDPRLIPQNPIRTSHDNSTSHDDNVGAKPNNVNPNSATTATTSVSQSSSSDRRAYHHPAVSQTHVSSPLVEEDNNNENDDYGEDLVRDDDKPADEECQHGKSKATTNNNLILNAIATTSYHHAIATTTTTTTAVGAIPIPKTTGLDSTSNMINQVMMCPNYSANTSTASLQQLLTQHFNDGYDDNMLRDDGDDDLFSSFLNSLINDEMIFPSCNSNIEDGSQPRQHLGVVPSAPPSQRGGGGGAGGADGGEDSSHAIAMNIISSSPSLGFRMIGGQWDDAFQS